jgi:hypothetical protein
MHDERRRAARSSAHVGTEESGVTRGACGERIVPSQLVSRDLKSPLKSLPTGCWASAHGGLRLR